MSKPLGELIKERRRRKGWSQTVFGDFVGMSAATIHRIEHSEKIPTDQETALMAETLGIELTVLLEACHTSQPQIPKSSFKTQWETAHPASYSGPVWIQVVPHAETRHLIHEFSLRWGIWERKDILSFSEEQASVYLLHYKHNDGLGLPLFMTLSQSCYVVFGKGEVNNEKTIDINFGWRRIEPPEPNQLWRYTKHYINWYLRKLMQRK